MVSAWNGWSVDEKAMQLTINSTGIARQAWVDSFCDSTTPISYDAHVSALTQRFKPDGQEELYKAEFRHRVRKRDENFIEYGYAIRRLAIRAFPKIKHDAREYLIMDQFLQGLTDVEMRRHITLAHPSGVDQAVSLATEYETLTQSMRAPQTHKPKQVAAVQEASTSNAEKLLQTMVDLMTQSSPNMKSRPPRPPRPPKPRLCFRCDQPGHILRDCPKQHPQGNTGDNKDTQGDQTNTAAPLNR